MSQTLASRSVGRRVSWRSGAGMLVGIAVVLGSLWKITRPSLPLVEGRSVEAWVALACDQEATAREKVLSFGAAAAPELGVYLVAPEPLRSRFSRGVAPHIPVKWVKYLPRTVDGLMRRRMSASLLASLGTNAAPARSRLVKALNDPSEYVRAPAAIALANLGVPVDEAIPGFVKLAGDTNTFVRMNCFPLLHRMRVPANDVLPFLRQTLRETSHEMQYIALFAIVSYGPESASMRGEVIPLVSSESSIVRSGAIRALGRMGSPDEPTRAALARALKDPVLENQVDALNALQSLGTAARPLVPQIIECMRNNVSGLWRQGQSALRAIAPETPEAEQNLSAE